ncbi:hypothetical protein VNO78_02826 [Psophocarpus tetragonolobus]|uniref:At2g35280-like TPR domain-containing protein n=1 Tax=Psophocarpus tetragonolobus TaxID=3891 RepID=A0AAN9XVI6_PSOTE
MSISRLVKKGSKRRCITYSNGSMAPIKSLPKDLLVEVIARVASSSVDDLCNMKSSCKDFLDASEDNYVWQNVSLDKFPLYPWVHDEKLWCFLERCRKSGNIDSLFREGMLQYFKIPNKDINGLQNLKVAAQNGHMHAQYIYGMILLCSHNDDLRHQGFQYVCSLRKSKCVMKCRNKLRELIRGLWLNGVIVRNHIALCRCKDTCNGWRSKNNDVWVVSKDDEDDDIDSCEYCRWDYEIEYFYRYLSCVSMFMYVFAFIVQPTVWPREECEWKDGADKWLEGNENFLKHLEAKLFRVHLVSLDGTTHNKKTFINLLKKDLDQLFTGPHALMLLILVLTAEYEQIPRRD